MLTAKASKLTETDYEGGYDRFLDSSPAPDASKTVFGPECRHIENWTHAVRLRDLLPNRSGECEYPDDVTLVACHMHIVRDVEYDTQVIVMPNREVRTATHRYRAVNGRVHCMRR